MNKREYFETRLRAGSGFLHLDARRPGVIVPDAFAHDPHLVLQYGYSLKIPIPDLAITDWGVRATLSFSRAPFVTAVPWPAVYAIHGDDGEGYVWREDMPGDLEQKPAATPAPAPARKRHLKLVD